MWQKKAHKSTDLPFGLSSFVCLFVVVFCISILIFCIGEPGYVIAYIHVHLQGVVIRCSDEGAGGSRTAGADIHGGTRTANSALMHFPK